MYFSSLNHAYSKKISTRLCHFPVLVISVKIFSNLMEEKLNKGYSDYTQLGLVKFLYFSEE